MVRKAQVQHRVLDRLMLDGDHGHKVHRAGPAEHQWSLVAFVRLVAERQEQTGECQLTAAVRLDTLVR